MVEMNQVLSGLLTQCLTKWDLLQGWILDVQCIVQLKRLVIQCAQQQQKKKGSIAFFFLLPATEFHRDQ